jgi:hypothetical protein
MAFDVAGARKAGYSDAEIAEHLAASANFDIKGAKSAGYTDGDIIAHLKDATEPVKQDPGALEAAKGVGEAALAAITGATTGTIAGALGGANQMGKDIAGLVTQGASYRPAQSVGDAAAQAAAGMTYAPRTESGQEIIKTVGEVAQNLAPMTGLTGQVAGITSLAGPAASQVRAAAMPAVKRATQAVRSGAAAATQAVKERAAAVMGTPDTPTPGTMGSAGAAGTDVATQRRALAADLPDPIQLTKGQATRSFEQQQFEREAAKNAKVGAPLRERFAEQNQKILGNFDAWLDQTGAQAPTLRATGAAVDKALVNKAGAAKAKIRDAYRQAQKAGETKAPVNTSAVADLLNESTSAESLAPIVTAARKELVRLGGASMDDAGRLVPGEITLDNMESLRKFINKGAGADPTNIKYAADIKRAIDAATEGLGGDMYQRARKLRADFAAEFENRGVVDRLLSKKPGTSDRSVALEDVFDHAILRGSLDDTKAIGQTLKRAGPEGQQAWAELRGQTLQYIKDQATKNVARDERGNAIVSAAGLDKAVKSLDADGKLDYIFGKRGAQQMRDLNDLAKVVYTSPPGSVNTSNTASIVTAALDLMLSGSTGIPAPLATSVRLLTGKLKDRKLAARVNESLGNAR